MTLELSEIMHAVLDECALKARSAANAAHEARAAFQRADEAARAADAEMNGAFRALLKSAGHNPDAYIGRFEDGRVVIAPAPAPVEAAPVPVEAEASTVDAS